MRLRLGHGFCHLNREVKGFGDLEAFLLASVCCVNIASDGQDALLGWHLEDQV